MSLHFKQPLVVGHKGEIGSFILNGLLREMDKALNIWCFDINETKDEVEERIRKADVIFLCVPIKNTVSWIVEHSALLKGKTIIEQASLKEWIYDEMEWVPEDVKDYVPMKDLDIRSMHVLFRPSVTHIPTDRRVGLFKGQFDEIWSEDIAKITKSTIVWYEDAKVHDMEMAIQQALLHRTLLTLGEMISKCNGRTYISQKVIELCERITAGNKELYVLIQQNKYVADVLPGFADKLENFDLDKVWPEKTGGRK